jgi:hypothetical protein
MKKHGRKNSASLEAVIDYLYYDEQKSWQEDGEPESHIYHDLERLIDWLSFQ